ERELGREQREHVAIRVAVQRRIGVAHAPQADELARVIQRHQHLGAGLLRRQDHLLARQGVRHDRPAPPDGLASEPRVRVEPERRPPPLAPPPPPPPPPLPPRPGVPRPFPPLLSRLRGRGPPLNREGLREGKDGC